MPKKKIISQPAPDTEPRPVPAPKSRKKAMPEAADAAAVRLPLRTAGARKAPHVPADPQSAVTSEGVKKCPVKQKREGAAEFHAAAGSRSGKY